MPGCKFVFEGGMPFANRVVDILSIALGGPNVRFTDQPSSADDFWIRSIPQLNSASEDFGFARRSQFCRKVTTCERPRRLDPRLESSKRCGSREWQIRAWRLLIFGRATRADRRCEAYTRFGDCNSHLDLRCTAHAGPGDRNSTSGRRPGLVPPATHWTRREGIHVL